MNWRTLLPIVGKLLEGAAAAGGPLAQLVVTFAVESAEFVIDAEEAGKDRVEVIQGMQVKIGKLLVDLEAVT